MSAERSGRQGVGGLTGRGEGFVFYLGHLDRALVWLTNLWKEGILEGAVVAPPVAILSTAPSLASGPPAVKGT